MSEQAKRDRALGIYVPVSIALLYVFVGIGVMLYFYATSHIRENVRQQAQHQMVPNPATVVPEPDKVEKQLPLPPPPAIVVPVPAPPAAVEAPKPSPTQVVPPPKKEVPKQVPKVVTVKAVPPTVIVPHTRPMPVTAVQAPLFRWQYVGIDPCNPNAPVYCTLEWALQQTGWPAEVQADFRQEVRYGHPAQTQVCSGWIGWMTWGKYERKFKPHVLADWPSGHCEPALQWGVTNITYGDYEIVKVNKCGNWGGRKGRAMEREIVPPWLGTIPVAACPD